MRGSTVQVVKLEALWLKGCCRRIRTAACGDVPCSGHMQSIRSEKFMQWPLEVSDVDVRGTRSLHHERAPAVRPGLLDVCHAAGMCHSGLQGL
mmetsp:Transcript_35464/g.78693  ORF Transcript_35464/g.78693 Transcript_35464/m.78693 type:complete len:93 (-) Transcript_35464:521-799(-)